MQRNKRLLLRKEIDWSLFNKGIILPKELNHIFGQTKNGNILNKNKSKTIRLFLDGDVYHAEITTIGSRKDEIEKYNLVLLYSNNNELLNKLRTLFKNTYDLYKNRKKRRNTSVKLPSSGKEYIRIYSTKLLDTYHIEAIPVNSIENIDSVIDIKTEEQTKSLNNIMELVYLLKSNQNIRDNWKINMIEFHKKWRNQRNIHLLNFEEKYIWEAKVLLDLDRKTEDIFDKNKDRIVVDFLNMRNKKFIKDIDESDLIQLIFQENFDFIDFWRLIYKLFIENGKEKFLEATKEKDFYLEEKDNLYIEKYNRSINSIIGELNNFKEIIKHYESTISQLQSKIKSRDEEIKILNNIIADLEEQLKESKEASDELEEIEKNLKEITDLLKNTDVL